MEQADTAAARRVPWWRSIGPALITACVVFGPGSLLISSNVGATYGYELLWLLVVTGVLMGTFTTMAARVGAVGGATPCTLIAGRLGRPVAALVGLNLCLICAAFQFSNNLAVAAAFDSLGVKRLFGDPARMTAQTESLISTGLLLAFNLLVIGSIFALRHVYKALERIMKIMVAVILACFLVNLFLIHPDIRRILGGLIPGVPEGLSLALPTRTASGVQDPLVLVAGLLGTTFSVAAAFFQGNLVREKGWTVRDYDRSIGDSIVGVAVLTCVSAVIMTTSATLLQGRQANDITVLATQLKPLLGPVTGVLFSVGLLAVAMNPFVINAMIGGAILADGLGKPARMSDPWSRRFTVVVLLIGMGVAMIVLHTPVEKIDAIIFGQAMTVIGNPLMAAAILWLANHRGIMGDKRNTLVVNILGGLGFAVVLLTALRVLYLLILRLA
ncbi:MAG TPA: divalent metal cation transporter [Sedimentisphaerales bacterium]|jgi:Mn2+/Fe2+ NRAMP family transporter|nr:divalent metal cation transporter [Sedimentisphaerales bacterium]HNU30334.1 divalent metal cation transporter [Sedimentisphaerales bacterium]